MHLSRVGMNLGMTLQAELGADLGQGQLLPCERPQFVHLIGNKNIFGNGISQQCWMVELCGDTCFIPLGPGMTALSLSSNDLLYVAKLHKHKLRSRTPVRAQCGKRGRVIKPVAKFSLSLGLL